MKRVTSFLFLATIFSCTFEKVHWNVAGTVVAPDDVDGAARELAALRDRWREGRLDGAPLSAQWRERLSRRTRVEELADLLQSLA